jgi:hypothetical protein
MYAIIWWKNLKERDYLGDIGVDGRVAWIVRRRVWAGFVWFRVGLGCELL